MKTIEKKFQCDGENSRACRGKEGDAVYKFNFKDYPHVCPICGNFAYVGGAHPADVKCTNRSCEFFDKTLGVDEIKKPQTEIEPTKPVPCDIWDDFDGFFS